VRILIVGGTGFIGSRVTRALALAGHEVAVLHRGGTPIYTGIGEILGDRNALSNHRAEIRAFRPDAVLDCILSNGSQAEQLVDVIRGIAGRVIALSSQDVYRAAGVLHRTEEGPLEPVPIAEDSPVRSRLGVYGPKATALLRSVFGWLTDDYDKIPVERAVLADPNLPATILRLPMVYGPGDPLHRFHPVVRRIDDGRPAILLEQSAATWRGTRGYVENIAEAIVLAVTSPQADGRIYNLGEEDTLTEAAWARAAGDLTGWNGRIVALPSGDMPAHLRAPYNLEQHWVIATRRMRDELGYRETVARSEALQRTIGWERSHAPPQINPALFDYAAEDAALARAAHV
jgi:nucleoside-diphosphate-sugar epimerase